MYAEQVLKEPYLAKFSNIVLACKELFREEYGYKWVICEPEVVARHDFWSFWETSGLGEAVDDITSKDRSIGIDKYLWFMLGTSICKRHWNMFNENIYCVMNDIQKPFMIGILEYSKHVRKMFEMSKLLPPPSRKNEE